jgi:hypothetical protein
MPRTTKCAKRPAERLGAAARADVSHRALRRELYAEHCEGHQRHRGHKFEHNRRGPFDEGDRRIPLPHVPFGNSGF